VRHAGDKWLGHRLNQNNLRWRIPGWKINRLKERFQYVQSSFAVLARLLGLSVGETEE